MTQPPPLIGPTSSTSSLGVPSSSELTRKRGSSLPTAPNQTDRRLSSTGLLETFKNLFGVQQPTPPPPAVMEAPFPAHLSLETKIRLANLAYGAEQGEALEAAHHATLHSSNSDYESREDKTDASKTDSKRMANFSGIHFPDVPKNLPPPNVPVLVAVQPQPLPRNATSPLHFGEEPHDGTPIRERYFETPVKIGRGAWGDVSLVQRLEDGQLFALKQFRRKPSDTDYPLRYLKRCASEFCIGSILNHPNCLRVIEYEFDQEHYTTAAAITEYVAGGDLYTAISAGTLTNQKEIDCLFVQLMRGVSYLHSIGVAHKDLKPENLLWDPAHSLLKIIDFGSAEIFLPPHNNPILSSLLSFPKAPETSTNDVPMKSEVQESSSVPVLTPPKFALIDGQVVKLSRGVCGSTPYIAPEEFVDDAYDPRQADIWACAIIYLAMCTRKFPWQCAIKTDPRYLRYIQLSHVPMLDRIHWQARRLISRMLHPNPFKRARIQDVMDDPWFKSIDVCVDERGLAVRRSSMSLKAKMHHHEAFTLAQKMKLEKETSGEEKKEERKEEKKETKEKSKERPPIPGLAWFAGGRNGPPSPTGSTASSKSPFSPTSEKPTILSKAVSTPNLGTDKPTTPLPNRDASLIKDSIQVQVHSGTPPKESDEGRGRTSQIPGTLHRDASQESVSGTSDNGVTFS